LEFELCPFDVVVVTFFSFIFLLFLCFEYCEPGVDLSGFSGALCSLCEFFENSPFDWIS
jgi:hypothetical protein